MFFWQKPREKSSAEALTVYDAVVLGAGFAGAFTAEELCRQLPPTARIAIIDSYGLFNSESSSRNECFKMHTGLHYIGDRKTAAICLENSVQMADAFYDLILNSENSAAPSRRGRHYLVDNSPFDMEYVKNECEYLKARYAELIEKYPNAIKVFGLPENFITYLTPDEYNYVAPSIPFKSEHGEEKQIHVVLGIETPECQVDLEKFRSHFQAIFRHRREQVTQLYGHTVTQIHYPEDFIGYVVETKYLDQATGRWKEKTILTKAIVNCTWQNIDAIDGKLNYNDNAPCTVRAKAIARVSVPEGAPASLLNMNTCIFSVGPHVSATRVPSRNNQYDDVLITYEPITNVGHYPSKLPTYLIEDEKLKILANFSPLQPSPQREQLKRDLGEKIREGAAQYIPDLKNCPIEEVGIGFVKMFSDTEHGNAYLYDKDSNIHKRRETGIQIRDLCYVSFSGIKMTYTFKTAETVAQILRQHLLLQGRLSLFLEKIANHQDFDQGATYHIKSTLLRSINNFLAAQMEEDGIFDLETIASTQKIDHWFSGLSSAINSIISEYSQQIQQHHCVAASFR